MRIALGALMLGILSLGLTTGSARADVLSELSDRENNFEALMKSTISPWFAQGETGRFAGVPVEGQTINLRYKAFLNPQAKANIVMVHGFGERIDKYSELAYDFYQAGYSVFLYDQRGFGRSTRLLKGSAAAYVHQFDHYVEDLKIFFDTIVLKRSPGRPHYMFAHSMGGAVTTLFLARYPQVASRAVLSTPMHEMNLGGMPRWFAASLVQGASAIGRGSSYAAGQKAPHIPDVFEHASTHSQTRWKWFADFTESPEERPYISGGASSHWVIEAFGATDRIKDEEFPKKIRIPVLLFQAGQDTWVAGEGQKLFCQRAPQCELIRYPHAKHEIYWETDSIRTRYMERVLDFFNKSSRKP